MKTLVVEDDFTSRLFLQTILLHYGECHVAVHGKEALKAFRTAAEEGRQYDLVCLDIMMPEMDGQAVLKEIRDLEEACGISYGKGVKIIMTTALDDPRTACKAFYELCNAYLVKPIDRAKLQSLLKSLGLIE